MITKTDFNFPKNELVGSVVFRPDFNKSEVITVNQAWSLFFTAGQEDKALGTNPELGRFFTYLFIGVGVAGTLWATIFNSLA
ncbi:hypothetical protein DP113_24330 [Brasilonema octagenarum UFV-E1]|jgi:hypothetical protein|uniref:Uncharacterized protein n=2 Tax=Brasilonema TaxID=383614 RepID=A0A856MKG7_9CYAN|nr:MULTISPECIES: hypothetical protein [Brasilonema]NMF63946.1 hypothetical protein [Brasilonema octagenarum UFV-OR1]QDL10624.1 hypothetical protein DP114_24420 [Brasilonema sennae CENA114]QDL16970.1 hypothetical protein DP113_24330 [Brasilonema octagenarum UFV-E1]